MSPQCNLARQEAKGKPVESWERSDAKSLWFWGQVPASEATTFARHAAKPGSFAREGGKLGGGFLLSPRTSLGSALMGACKDEHKVWHHFQEQGLLILEKVCHNPCDFSFF